MLSKGIGSLAERFVAPCVQRCTNWSISGDSGKEKRMRYMYLACPMLYLKQVPSCNTQALHVLIGGAHASLILTAVL